MSSKCPFRLTFLPFLGHYLTLVERKHRLLWRVSHWFHVNHFETPAPARNNQNTNSHNLHIIQIKRYVDTGNVMFMSFVKKGRHKIDGRVLNYEKKEIDITITLTTIIWQIHSMIYNTTSDEVNMVVMNKVPTKWTSIFKINVFSQRFKLFIARRL